VGQQAVANVALEVSPAERGRGACRQPDSMY
jgi:hypothetical protein